MRWLRCCTTSRTRSTSWTGPGPRTARRNSPGRGSLRSRNGPRPSTTDGYHTTVLLAQLRSLVVDLLELSGLDHEEAVDAVPPLDS